MALTDAPKNQKALNPEQRKQFEKIRATQGADAAKSFRQNIISGGLTGAPKKDRPLNPEQRKQFREIKRTQGADAAKEFRQGIKSGGLTGAAAPSYNTVDGQVSSTINDMIGGLGNRPSFDDRVAQFGALPDANMFNEQRQQMIDSTVGEFDRMMGPRFEQEQEMLQQQLRNRGIPMGSAEYNNALSQLSERQNSARQSAMNQALSIGGAEQSRLHGLSMDGRSRMLEEALLGHEMPYRNIGALAGLYDQGAGRAHATNMQRAGFDYDRERNQFNAAERRWEIENTPRGPGYDVMGLERMKHANMMERDRTNFDHNLSLAQQTGNQNRPRTSDTLGQIGGSIVGGIGKGIGGQIMK